MPKHAPFLKINASGMDSILLSLSLDERIGQLLFYQPLNLPEPQTLIAQTKAGKIGGVLLEGLLLPDYLNLRDTLMNVSPVPLFQATDQQVSLHNQFAELTSFPSATSIAAIEDDSLTIGLTQQLLTQCGQLGINFAFSPLLEQNKAKDSAYNFAVFENEKTIIEARAEKRLEELQENKIFSVAGNFRDFFVLAPDSTNQELDTLLIPYRKLVSQGLSGILIDPVVFQQDSIHKLPSKFLSHYLKDRLEFDGLIFGEWNSETPFEVLAYAGVDVFIVKDSLEKKHQYLRDFVQSGIFTQKELNDRARKVMLAKRWLQKDSTDQIASHSLTMASMTDVYDEFYTRQLYEASLTLAHNPGNVLPFQKTNKKNFRLIEVSNEDLWQFQYYFSKYTSFSEHRIKPAQDGTIRGLDFKRFYRSRLIVALNEQHLQAKRDSAFITSLNQLAAETDVVVVNFGNPYNLQYFDTTVTMVQLYECNAQTEAFAAQLLFGALQAKGHLPLAINEFLTFKQGIDTTSITRLKYGIPEEVGIASYKLVGIDAIARSAIGAGATPGCQVLVAKEGKIIYSKSFGTHTYDGKQLVQKTDLYDLASITKVAATALATMRLYENKALKLKQRLSQHLDLDKKSPIRNIRLKELLTHRSGLQSNMPIAPYIMYKDSLDNHCNEYFCWEERDEYQVSIADSFYMDQRWLDTIWQQVYELKPRRRKRTLYSDVNFNLMQKIIETKVGQRLDKYMDQHFYGPLNLERLTFRPRDKFRARQIVPTAEDSRWRGQLIRGYVHDESAALLNGVGGNAGLFSNAEELAVLFQMLLNEGTYGGQRFFNAETIEAFTKEQSGTGRGLAFDVQGRKGTRSCAPKASASTFGHTGFTGTCVWVDPEEELVFIFLSNRIHPNVRNRKLFRNDTRKRMHSIIYEAIDTYQAERVEEVEPMVLEASAGD